MAAKMAEDGTDPKSEGQTVPKIREPDRRLFLAKKVIVVPFNVTLMWQNEFLANCIPKWASLHTKKDTFQKSP